MFFFSSVKRVALIGAFSLLLSASTSTSPSSSFSSAVISSVQAESSIGEFTASAASFEIERRLHNIEHQLDELIHSIQRSTNIEYEDDRRGGGGNRQVEPDENEEDEDEEKLTDIAEQVAVAEGHNKHKWLRFLHRKKKGTQNPNSANAAPGM